MIHRVKGHIVRFCASCGKPYRKPIGTRLKNCSKCTGKNQNEKNKINK